RCRPAIPLPFPTRRSSDLELGFRLTQRVNAPLPDIAALQAIVGEIAPVLELPDLATAGNSKPNALDLIAANVGAKRFIAGPGRRSEEHTSELQSRENLVCR